MIACGALLPRTPALSSHTPFVLSGNQPFTQSTPSSSLSAQRFSHYAADAKTLTLTAGKGNNSDHVSHYKSIQLNIWRVFYYFLNVHLGVCSFYRQQSGVDLSMELHQLFVERASIKVVVMAVWRKDVVRCVFVGEHGPVYSVSQSLPPHGVNLFSSSPS